MSRSDQPVDTDSKAARDFSAQLQSPIAGSVTGGGAADPRHRSRIGGLLLATAATLTLAACEPGTGPFASSPAPTTAAAAGETGTTTASKPRRSTRIVDRDVEAPQVFQVTEEALWDGRPSLGGVWVASPDVTDPERVIMRNPTNGKFVIGALFKRERDNPGPKLQISSDAAEALGLLAGQPGKLSVTALRREEAEEAAPEAPVLDSNESLAANGKPAAAGAVDAGGVTTTALDAPAGGKPAAGKPAAGKPATGAAATATGTTAATPVAPAANEPKKTKRQLRREAKEAEAAAKAQAEAAAKAPPPLSATGLPAPGATAPGATAAAKPAAAAPAKAAASGRSIQIGFFSQESNATQARDRLAKAGVTAQVRKESSQGKDYWSVFTKGDAAILKKIKSAGFADAYMLK